MKKRLLNARFIASLAMFSLGGLVLAAQTAQAADRKVLFENFTASW
ncbi:MAG: hypothetical protein JSV91_14200 [Phycisphaerales bacterium]|nr:MAG: hypothetical protein JSV91_14200 [Phycisphaerales bacterium]